MNRLAIAKVNRVEALMVILSNENSGKSNRSSKARIFQGWIRVKRG